MIRGNFYVIGTIARKTNKEGKKVWFPKVFSSNPWTTPEVIVPFKTKKAAKEFLAEVSKFDEGTRIAITNKINNGETPKSAIKNANLLITA